MANRAIIQDKVYQVGGSGLSHPADCLIYLVKVGNNGFVMIDCGSGENVDKLLENIDSTGVKPEGLKALILTHCHIDHIGAAHLFKERSNCRIIAHKADADAMEGKDNLKTAAAWYALDYKPITIDTIISGDSDKLQFSEVEFNILHTPGHTPGSISVYCDISGKRVLFGQDIHGPFDPSFGSNIEDWKRSMKRLLDLDADILCEGHYGIFQPKDEVRNYIEGYLVKY